MSDFTFKTYVNSKNETIFWWDRFSNHNKEILHIEKAGITEPDPNYRVVRRRENYSYDGPYVLEYVTDGKGYLESEGIRREVGAGDVYIVHKKTVHSYYADKKDPFRKKWINVCGSFIGGMISAFMIDAPFFVMRLGADAERIFDDIHSCIRNTTATDTDFMVEHTMEKLLELFLLIDRRRRAESEEMSLKEQIVRYIRRNICLDIDIPKLCERFFISSSTLYRMFSRTYGISPKEFILREKIETAKRMIVAEDIPMSAIAAALSFYDSHHFLRTFKKYTGISPSEYKRMYSQ